MDNAAIAEKARELRSAYYREYRRQHKEKYKDYERRRWEKKARAALEAEKAGTQTGAEGSTTP